MDRTILNIVSLIIGGVGLFLALVGYNTPELNQTFFDENPFAKKRDTIQTVHTWSFAIFASLGVAIQVGAEVWSDPAQARLFSPQHYAAFALVAILVVSFLAIATVGLARLIARRIWRPRAVEDHREMIDICRFVIENGGWERQHIAEWQSWQDSERQRVLAQNAKSLEDRIAHMESLLEVKSTGGTRERLARISSLAPVAL
jgi:hypothetical protein